MSSVDKYDNPIYSLLVEQLIVQNQVFANKSRTEYLTTLLSPIDDSHNLFASYNAIADEILNQNDLRLSDIWDCSALLFSAKRAKYSIPSKFIANNYCSLLNDLICSSIFPYSQKSFILFLIRDITQCSDKIATLNSQLLIYVKSRINKNNFQNAFDFLFGCNYKREDFQDAFWMDLERQSKNWNREKLSKCIISLMSNNLFTSDYNFLIHRLESQVKNEFSHWTEPDIWFSLIESEKIINSNLEFEQIQDLINNLGRSGTSWLSPINKIHKDGVFIKLNSFHKTFSFSPTEDALSLIALNVVKRQKVIQINEEDYNELRQSHELQIKDLSVDRKGVLVFTTILLLSTIATTYFVSQEDFSSLGKNITKIVGEKFPPETMKDWLKLVLNPLVILIMAVWWNIKNWKTLENSKRLTIREGLKNFPIFGRITKFFTE